MVAALLNCFGGSVAVVPLNFDPRYKYFEGGQQSVATLRANSLRKVIQTWCQQFRTPAKSMAFFVSVCLTMSSPN